MLILVQSEAGQVLLFQRTYFENFQIHWPTILCCFEHINFFCMIVISISNIFHIQATLEIFFQVTMFHYVFIQINTFLHHQNKFTDLRLQNFFVRTNCFFRSASNFFWQFLLQHNYLHTIESFLAIVCTRQHYNLNHIFFSIMTIFALSFMNSISKITCKILI